MKMKAEERTLDAPQVAEAKIEEGGLAIEKNPYGKFKDSQSLLKAYESLESEFTRRSQRLKTLEGELLSRSQTDKTEEVRKNQETEDITGRYSFVSKYGREIEDELAKSGNSISKVDAYVKVLERKIADFENNLERIKTESEKGVDFEEFSKTVIKDYLKKITEHKPYVKPYVGSALIMPPQKPKSIAEASAIAKRYIKRKGEQ